MTETKPVQSAGDVKRARTRAALLNAARALFTERGWYRTRIEDVAKTAGVSAATAYNHFKSKQILMGFVYRPLVGRLLKSVERALKDDSDPMDAILRHFYDLAALARRRRQLTESLVAAMHEQTLKHGQVAVEPDEEDIRHLVPLYTMLADLMEHGRKRGLLRSGSSVIAGAIFYTDTLLHHALNLREESAHDTALLMLDQLLLRWAANPEVLSHHASITLDPDRQGEEDLSLVLHRLMRQGPRESRQSLANTALTREYLEAGLRLGVTQHAQHGDMGSVADALRPYWNLPPADETYREIERARRQAGDEQEFHDRWPAQDDFALDLLSYVLWTRYWRPESARKSAELISNAIDPVHAAQEVGNQELESILESPVIGLSFIATAAADRFPELKTTTGTARKAIRRKWAPIYEEMLAVNDLKLRPDISIEDLADILSIVVEGVASRVLSGPQEEGERLRGLLRKAVLAVLVSAVDSGDDLKLEDLLRRFIVAPRQISSQ
ncbi:TetR/AcrR family transcriptional regulator [Nonomuraea sp. NPDC051941]|uniref:TetR/AcrR family transcriptional regulator n=1 Tax=Nonomuraea sp. NPDC051941 TaxID=3364373 RepID=UPI0037C56B7B